MTTEEKRVKTAEACGWTKCTAADGNYGDIPHWRKDGELTEHCCSGHQLHQLPDFFADLNAMHEAEKVMTEAVDQRKFVTHLMEITQSKWPWEWLHATAAQRAEAFGRTLNLWKE